MSVSRRELIDFLEAQGFRFHREGGRHTIYVNEKRVKVAVKRHRLFDRISANEVCKDAGLKPPF